MDENKKLFQLQNKLYDRLNKLRDNQLEHYYEHTDGKISELKYIIKLIDVMTR